MDTLIGALGGTVIVPLLSKLPGVPHWNKQWSFLNNDLDIVKYLQEKYGTNLDTFKFVRKQLKIDPKNLFLNSTMAQVIKLMNSNSYNA